MIVTLTYLDDSTIEIHSVHTVKELLLRDRIQTETYGNYPIEHKGIKSFSVKPQ